MRVTITAPGRFPPAFHAARWHESRGELARIVSPAPFARTKAYGVTRRSTIALTQLGAWNRIAQKMAPRALQPAHQHAFSVVFDEIASRSIGDCDVVNAWCSTALRTIRAAHRRGMPVTLEVASAHVAAQARVLREEYERFGMGAPLVSRGVVARTVAEYEEADAIVAMSSVVRRTLVEQGVAASKIAVVPCGADTVPAIARSQHVGPPRILFVGGLTLRKGLPYLLDAYKRMKIDATLRLVGAIDGELLRGLGGLPDGLRSGCEAAGTRSGKELAREYGAADIFVLPSVEDGFGLVTAEAMSAGLPVVVSDAAGSADLIEDGVNGYIVPARDAGTLAEMLDLLAGDRQLRERVGAAARASMARHTWDDYGRTRDDLVYRPLFGARSEARAYARAA